MALRRVTDTVHTLYDSVHGGVITDGVICTIEVIVDGTRKTDAANVKLASKVHRTRQRAITTNDYQCVNLFLLMDS